MITIKQMDDIFDREGGQWVQVSCTTDATAWCKSVADVKRYIHREYWENLLGFKPRKIRGYDPVFEPEVQQEWDNIYQRCINAKAHFCRTVTAD